MTFFFFFVSFTCLFFEKVSNGPASFVYRSKEDNTIKMFNHNYRTNKYSVDRTILKNYL